MKLQYLTVIFLLIIIPILIVYSAFINNQITTLRTENVYNARLLNSTYDAIKAYQLNTINNATSDVQSKKVEDIEGAVKTFFNSLSVNFGYEGYRSTVMQEYVPAVVFTMYDGYYIYSPFVNTLTGINNDDVDENYKDGEILYGLKPNVYYSCRYTRGAPYNDDFVITYSLDNYITIGGQIYSSRQGRIVSVNESGYLIGIDTPSTNNGFKQSGNNYTYEGITISSGDTEALCEYIGNTLYYYVKINGTKYYYTSNYIFYIDDNGKERIQVRSDQPNFSKYTQAIFNNNYGYEYYKNAYEFTDRVLNDYGLSNLTVSNIYNYDEVDEVKDNFITSGNIFEGRIQESDSKFNQHRAEVIRYVIEGNLKTSISEFSRYSKAKENVDFIMPKISETDWEILANNVCIATFLQGMSIGGKVYNGYSVVPNNLNKEHVDENDIYILTTTGEYTRANDKNLLNVNLIPNKSNSYNPLNTLSYYPGVLNINFENKVDLRGDTKIDYSALKYNNGTKIVPYYGSYTGLIGSSSLNDITGYDMYKYMRGQTGITINADLRKAYYMALGRERKSAYNVNNSLEESSL